MQATTPWNTLVTLIVGGIGLASCATLQVPRAGNIHALADPAVIERGRYLAYGPGHCAACHGDPARETQARTGIEVPMSGGMVFDLGPLGTITAPNITSDPVHGIGAVSDDTLVRSMRYGVSRHGRPMLPFMSLANLSDEDLEALLSFIRTLTPVPKAQPGDLSWLGSLVARLVLEAEGPTEPARARVPERSAEYGHYLAHTMANCHGCHTRRSKRTGAFIGPAFAGGMEFEERGGTYVSANLTPIAGGFVQSSTEQEFVDRFRVTGRVRAGSPMPWEAFARMTDNDLAAIYRYLRTLEPARTPGST